MTVEAVIFDIGNVLIEWQPERYYDRVIGEARRREMFAAVDLHFMNDLVDRGHDFRGTVYDTALRHPGWEAEIRMWHDDWLKLAGPEIPRSIRLLRALRARGVPVFALSNFGIGSFDVAVPAYPFLDEFDRRYISGHMAMAKPDAEIYAAVEADCGLPPGGLLFADDRADNIATARARGWQTHLFTTPERFAELLVSKGLLTEAEAA